MAHNYTYRFELKPGKFVYVQHPDAILRGRQICKRVSRRFRPDPIFYHLGKRGGHVAALRHHQHSDLFSQFDIQNFFGAVTRSKVTRSLKALRFSAALAFEYAVESVVVDEGRKFVPFGFCQSPLLATLALEQSLLGTALKQIRDRAAVRVSVYMDDILLSGEDRSKLVDESNFLVEAARNAQFPLSGEKFSIASEKVLIFNCALEQGEITLQDERMEKFIAQYGSATEAGKFAIAKYINALSPLEKDRFLAMT